MLKSLLIIVILVLTISCKSRVEQDIHLLNFSELFTGKFSSKEQANKELGYTSVVLVNKPIWKNRSGKWFYQELYNEMNTSSIYYQRIINVRRLDSVIISTTNYIIPNQKKYINAWKDPSILDHLTLDSLKVREGCDVLFKKKTSTIYQGKTKKESCLSSFSKEITYITSNIVISKDKISTWDRGYDNSGKQVWGKIEGPYKFVRVPED